MKKQGVKLHLRALLFESFFDNTVQNLHRIQQRKRCFCRPENMIEGYSV